MQRGVEFQDAQSDFVLGDQDPFRQSLCSTDPDHSITSLALTKERNSKIFSTGKRGMYSPIKLVKVINSQSVSSTEAMARDSPEYVASFLGVDNTMLHTMEKIYVASHEMATESDNLPKPTITQV